MNRKSYSFYSIFRSKKFLLHHVGLHDTIFDVDNDKERAQAQGLEPNGFCFEGADADGVDYALNRHASLPSLVYIF